MNKEDLIEKLNECLVNIKGVSDILRLLIKSNEEEDKHNRSNLYILMQRTLLENIDELEYAVKMSD